MLGIIAITTTIQAKGKSRGRRTRHLLAYLSVCHAKAEGSN